jgi:hypothetical protein
MIPRERHFLQSEISALDELISQTPEEDVIDRKSLEARKKEVAAKLSILTPPYYEPARGRLKFRGKPTVRSQGVYADFAGKALDKYDKMVHTLDADQYSELGPCGPIPKRDEFQLMVTGTTIGSFGFEIEEVPKTTGLLTELSPAKLAMEKANAIIELSADSSDDLIADAIADMSARAVEAVREFLEVMEDSEAEFAIELDDKYFPFLGLEKIKNSRDRLRSGNIREWDDELTGEFQGAIPDGRTFEFLKDKNEVIRGKIRPEIEDPIKINYIVEKPVKIKVHAKQVGFSRPRYMLISYEELEDNL